MGEQTTEAIAESHVLSNLALGEQFITHLKSQAYSPHTIRAYNKVCRDFFDFIRVLNVLDVERPLIREYLYYLKERGADPHTIVLETSALRSFYRFLCRIGLLDRSPFDLIRSRRLPKRLPRVLTEEEAVRLIEAARTPRDSALLQLLYSTGVRRAELCAIKLADINWDKSEWSILIRGKNKREGVVYFGQFADKTMRAYLESTGRTPVSDGYLFQGRNGGPLSGQEVYRVVRTAAARAGLGKVGAIAIRHTFCTVLHNRGVHIRFLQALLRHESVSTTAGYCTVTTADLERVLRRFHPSWQTEKK